MKARLFFSISLAFFLTPKTFAAAPKSNCSAETIAYYAKQAPKSLKDGKLWGTKICTPATKAKGWKCYNGCARVVSTILRKAGCGNSITSSAGNIWDAMKRRFKPSKKMKKGCVLGLNGVKKGSRGRLTLPGKGGSNVAYRHVAIAFSSNRYVDNKSNTNSAKIVTNNKLWSLDNWIYEKPLYLCPTK